MDFCIGLVDFIQMLRFDRTRKMSDKLRAIVFEVLEEFLP